MKNPRSTHGILSAVALAIAAGHAQAGSIARLVYDGVTGATTASLTNASIFPDQPTFREQLDDYTPTAAGTLVRGLQNKESSGANYGAYIRGYLEAPTTGDFTFFVASDDASELWLSTDTNPANRRKVAFETSFSTALFSGPRLDERRSAAINLVRGQKYFLEVIHKQGTGTSGLQVGWQRPDGTQEVIPARHLAQHPLDPYLGRSEPNLAPTFNPSGLNGGDLPGTLNVNEGDDLTAELDVIASQPTTIQWRRAGNLIAGENLSFLSLRRVSAAWNGQTLQATIANAFGQATTASAVLSVTPDTTPPSIASVDHRGNPNQVTVTFSEPVATAGASSVANYELRTSGGTLIPVASAALSEDGRTVRLDGAFNFAVNGQYQLTVRNIDDLAASANRISPNPTTVPFSFSGEFLGPIAFDPAHPLQSLAVLENRTATFEAFLKGAKPWSYQWIRNGSPIAGANASTLQVVANAANAGTFRVAVSNDFSAATSADVQLTVIPDTVPAQLNKVLGLAGINTVRLTFDEVLATASATNLLNYAIEGVAIQQATLLPDGKAVLLQTGPLTKGQAYLVSYIGLQDISVAGNPASGTASFVAEVDYAGEVVSDSPVRYWRFNETTGTTVASLARGVDTLATGVGTLVNSPALNQPSLLPSAPEDGSLQLTAASSQRITVPNGSDINATAGPWAKRTVEFWFKANSVPAPDATGLAATAGIWEEGAATRAISVYLWRDPANTDPNQAELIFHSYNNASDGPGAPFGITTLPAVIAQRTVTVGQTYHVVAVLDGDKTGTTGNAILYVNGSEVSRAPGVGQIYNHTGDIQIGRGNALTHTGDNGNFGFFDGFLDEYAVYNTALSAQRVAAHYQAGLGGGGSGGTAPSLTKAETRGNPNRIYATFSTPVNPASATTVANYTLTPPAGAALPISSVVLLPGQITAQISGNFNLLPGTTYQLSIKDVTDQSSPARLLNPNPSTLAVPFTANGSVGIGASSELASRKGYENQVIRFAVVPTGSGPFAYQWLRNGTNLPGETRPELLVTTTTATVGDYTVQVRNDFSSLTSPVAKLTLDVDFTPPQILSASALAGSLHTVSLSFDEPLDPVTATNTARYSLGSTAVLSAALDASGQNVTLKTAPLVNGQVYTLAINGLKDRAAAGNVLNTTTVFAAAVSYIDEILAERPVRFWRLDESTGSSATSLAATLDSATTATATYVNGPRLGVAGLVPNHVRGTAVQLTATNSQRLTVPNGSDLNANVGPWAKRTIQFWFRANSAPAIDATGLAATAGLWEEGGANRNIAVYLWRDPANTNPNEAELILNAVNNVADGGGSPFGPPADAPVFTQTRVTVGTTYHVVAVFDGDPTGLTGNLILYVNGVEAGRATGLGQIFNHTGDIQIGRGNALTHDNNNGDWGFFDGVIDEVAVFNTALTGARVAQLHQIASTQPPGFVEIDVAGSQLGDRNVLAGQPVQFSVSAKGDGTLTYQWYRDGVAIQGATGTSLQFVATPAVAGRYTVNVQNAFSSATSQPARLTVETQSQPPVLASASAVAGTVNEVRLSFARTLDTASATNPATYSVGSLGVTQVGLSADGRTVTLRTGQQQPGQSIPVTITSLRDRDTPEGTLSTNLIVQARLSFADEVIASGAVRYWRFEETGGTNAFSAATRLDSAATAAANLFNAPTLAVPGLVPNLAGNSAIQLVAANTNRIVVPNGSDLNINTGPWAKRTFSFWFKANSLPRGGASPQAPVLFEEGGDTRGLALYLYGTQDSANPSEALLVWNAYNNATADGPSGGWGVALGNKTNAVYLTTPIRAGEVYHVVAVLDGDTKGRTGSIRLHVNGQAIGTATGAGQIFNHSADIQIGRGAFVRHDGITAGNLHYFDGVLDEFAIFNTALPPERASQLFQFGQSDPLAADGQRISEIRVEGGNFIVSWQGSGRLAVSDSVEGTFTPIPGATSPHSEPINASGSRFFRLVP